MNVKPVFFSCLTCAFSSQSYFVLGLRAENLGRSFVMSVSLFLYGFGFPVMLGYTSQCMHLFDRKVFLAVSVEDGLAGGRQTHRTPGLVGSLLQ